MNKYLQRIEELSKQLHDLEDQPQAQWFRWKEIENRFQSLKYMAQQECTEVYALCFDNIDEVRWQAL